MDIFVQREALLKPLQAASSVVEKKQTQPILANVLLKIEDQLSLTVTDHEIEFIGFSPIVEVKKNGTTTVSARKLFDICRALPENVLVQLTLEKNTLLIRAADTCFTLNTLPPEEFPNLEHVNYNAQFQLKPLYLKQLLSKTHFAMGLQDIRNYLNGTLLDISKNTIKAVAADGHRLALCIIEHDSLQGVEANLILPRKSVLEIMRLLNNEDDGLLDVQLNEQRLSIKTQHFIFSTKLIQAEYPNYQRLIPKGNTIAEADRELIKQALTRVAILSNEKFRGVRFEIESGKLLITANNSDQEQAAESIPLNYSGEKFQIGFNVAYLLDAVSSLVSDCVRYVFSDPSQGVLIESVNADQKNLCYYVVMPMRL